MPRFVIERQSLLPIYQRLIIDAPDITTAYQEAVEDDDWESAEEDGDGSGATTKGPGRTASTLLVDDSLMLDEVAGGLRSTVRREIGGRTDHTASTVPKKES